MADLSEQSSKDGPSSEVEINDIEGFSILESSSPPPLIDKNAPPLIPEEPVQISTNYTPLTANQTLKRKRMSSVIQPSVVSDALKSMNGRGSVAEIISWISHNFPECFGDFSTREMLKVYLQIGKILCKNKLWFSLELSDEAQSQKSQSISKQNDSVLPVVRTQRIFLVINVVRANKLRSLQKRRE